MTIHGRSPIKTVELVIDDHPNAEKRFQPVIWTVVEMAVDKLSGEIEATRGVYSEL